MIRPATRSDLSDLVKLIHDLAEYERSVHEVEIDQSMLAHALFDREPSAYAVVAASDAEVIGFALYFRTFSTWTGKRGIYLEDLFVRPEHRGHGVGKALLASVARTAITDGCARLEWSVLDWNKSAIDFYRSIGAVAMDDWTKYRLSHTALSQFADRS